MPLLITMANGFCSLAPEPSAKAKGSILNPVVSAVKLGLCVPLPFENRLV